MSSATGVLASSPVLETPDALLASATRKNLVRLVPILAIAYFFNYIDRTNVGFAALTMNRDLGLTNAQFGAAAGLFFVGYCLLEVPSNLILYRVGARRWLARIMISWGLLSAATALVTGPTSFYAVRVLTGAAEAGFFPGVLFYLTTWFPAQNRIRVLSWFLVAIPLSSVVGGPLSATLLELDGLLGWKGWQWLFVIEGLPACVMGVLTLWLLRDTPREATWLTPGERKALLDVLEREQTSRPRKDFLAALRDSKVWILTGILFSYWLGINGIAIWLPLILKGHGLTTMEVGWLSAIPYLVASIAMIFWARYMDRTGQHLGNLAATCLVASAGFVISVLLASLIPAMIGITFAVIGLSSARPAFYSLPSRFLTGAAAAGGIAFINAVGSLSGYVAPWIMGILKDTTGSFNSGLLALAAMLLVSALLTGLLKLTNGPEMRIASLCALILTGATLASLLPRGAAADEIRLLASNAVRAAYQEALPAFESATGHHVTAQWGGTLDIIRRAASLEPLDVVVVPDYRVDALIAQGAAVNRVDVAVSRIGVASRRGGPLRDLTTLAGLKAALLAAPSIVLSSGPSQVHMLALFRELGVMEAIKDNIIQLKPGLSVGEALLDGHGELGFTQVSEFLPIKGIDYLGPLPPGAQANTTFSAGLLVQARSPAAASGLMNYLAQQVPAGILKEHGLDPVHAGR